MNMDGIGGPQKGAMLTPKNIGNGQSFGNMHIG
jgi:hypothetical protein